MRRVQRRKYKKNLMVFVCFLILFLRKYTEEKEAEEAFMETSETVCVTAQDEFPDDPEELQRFMQEENELAGEFSRDENPFVEHTRQCIIGEEVLGDLDRFLEFFYTVDANTYVDVGVLNPESLLAVDLSMEQDGNAPQILIYHSHSLETYADSVPQDPNTSVVGVGEHLAEILRTRYGYGVIHHTATYDQVRNQAYSKALPDLEKLLEDNPSIQVIIDLHRDQMPEETRLVMDVDGQPTARFMFFNGLSRTKNTGEIAYLTNDNLAGNLAFSFQMDLKANEYYPGLSRKIYLKGYRYNMHLRPRSLLIELGAQNNTVEEAMNACNPIAHILHMVLAKEETDWE